MESIRDILLIDDNASCNFIMEEFIKFYDDSIVVKSTLSVNDSLDHLRDCNHTFPQLIFIDLNMPVLTGFDFARIYSEEFAKDHPDTKLYMLTSSLRDDDKFMALSFDCIEDFVSKSDLEQILEQTLCNSGVY